PDTLHDLLPHIATFGVIEMVELAGLLRKFAGGDIGAVARHAAENAVALLRLAACRPCLRRDPRPGGQDRLRRRKPLAHLHPAGRALEPPTPRRTGDDAARRR